MHKEKLTIVISTFNRCGRLRSNLNRMLSYDEKRVKFLIGDNASSDGTAAYLVSLVSDRTSIIYGKKNNGFENFWLLSFEVLTEYFLFLNDRDYIDEKNLTEICDLLERIEPCQIVSCEAGFWKRGYLYKSEFIDAFFFSRHPGTLIYASGFCKRILDKERILRYIQDRKQNLFNIDLDRRLLSKLEKGFAYKKYLISQPKDRDMIKQERKDYYDCSYVTVEYRLREFDDWAQELEETYEKGHEKIFLGMIKNSLFTVTYEFYYSIQSDAFIVRNHCYGYKKSDWYQNGSIYIRHVLDSKITNELKITNRVMGIWLENIYRFFWGLGRNRLAEIKHELFKKGRRFS